MTMLIRGGDDSNSFQNTVKLLFQYVKKKGANVASKLSVLKSIALGSKKDDTTHADNIETANVAN